MRTRLVLALLSIPVVTAAAVQPAQAQRDGDGERTVTIYRDRDGYRDRIRIPVERARIVRERLEATRRYRERAVHARIEAARYRERALRDRLESRRYREAIRLRNQYRHRDGERYPYEVRRRRSDWVDLALRAADARYHDRFERRDGRRWRHVGRGVYIDIDLY